jgi:GTP-binding protein LepA
MKRERYAPGTPSGRGRRATELLPGYREVKPMVFSGLYPSEPKQYEELRDALEKLKLNDASLFYEPEVSAALGFGFRCGFLGLLHMEIVQERLEREFDLDLVSTVPNVEYHLVLTDGSVLHIENPSAMPDPATVDQVHEPYVRARIVCPSEYIGNVQKLCHTRRGVFIEMHYLDPARGSSTSCAGRDRARLHDKLKGSTRGCASLDWEFPVPADGLVRLTSW